MKEEPTDVKDLKLTMLTLWSLKPESKPGKTTLIPLDKPEKSPLVLTTNKTLSSKTNLGLPSKKMMSKV